MAKPRDPLLPDIFPDDMTYCPACKRYVGKYTYSESANDDRVKCARCRAWLVNRYDDRGYVVKAAKGTSDDGTD